MKMNTTSYVVEYTEGHNGPDRLGGLPSHLPPRWPQCQCCQDDLSFIGQIYSSERCYFAAYLCLHFYMCTDDCTGHGDLLLHMEPLPKTAKKNLSNLGTVHPDQPNITLTYSAITDPILSEDEAELEDAPHIFEDKVGGLFPYEGDGLDINEDNVCYLQMIWPVVGIQIFVCNSKERGVYLATYC